MNYMEFIIMNLYISCIFHNYPIECKKKNNDTEVLC